MKIGIYDPYLDDLGGGEKYMMTIAECLSKGNDVHVFWDDLKVQEDLAKRFSIDFSKIHFVPNIFSTKYSKIKRIIQSMKYDIIIVLSDGSVPILLSKRTFLHIQQPLIHSKVGMMTRLKLKKISGIFCNAEYTKKYIDSSFGIHSKVLYPPIILKATEVQKENIILHVGRFRLKEVDGKISDFKKQSVMIDAFSTMAKQGIKNWKFVLCVSVKDEDEKAFQALKARAHSLSIEFAVNKTNSELWDYYSRAKIYWHASGYGEDLDKNPELAEHFGISTVEAMGAGAVPVVINAGGQREIVTHEENGLLWDSIDDLIHCTTSLITDEKKLNRLSREAKKRADYFSENNFCQNVTAILDLI